MPLPMARHFAAALVVKHVGHVAVNIYELAFNTEIKKKSDVLMDNR